MNDQLTQYCRRLLHNRRGAVTIMFIGLLFVAIPLLGLSFDMARYYIVKTDIQFTADAASLAGSMATDKYIFASEGKVYHQPEVVDMVVKDVVNRNNAVNKKWQARLIGGTPTINQTKHSVTVEVETEVDTVFLGAIGINSFKVRTDSESAVLMRK